MIEEILLGCYVTLEVGIVRDMCQFLDVFVGALANFIVDCQSSERLEETNEQYLLCVLTPPSKDAVKCRVQRVKRDVYNISYVPQEEGMVFAFLHWV